MSQVNPAELAYGSDKTGLVWGYLFEPGKTPQQVECAAALHWLSTPPTAGNTGFVWLHLSLSNAAAERWMRQSLQLADAFYESLHEGVGSNPAGSGRRYARRCDARCVVQPQFRCGKHLDCLG